MGYRLFVGLLVAMLAVLQYRVWFGDSSYLDQQRLEAEIAALQAEALAISQENALLASEVEAIREGGQPLEAIARSKLGMIMPGETLILVIGDDTER